jgi:hypothetical protein
MLMISLMPFKYPFLLVMQYDSMVIDNDTSPNYQYNMLLEAYYLPNLYSHNKTFLPVLNLNIMQRGYNE